jgi:hypothetical protein
VPGGLRYRVSLHREVAKTIASRGGAGSEEFRPRLSELFEQLATDPKRFSKKAGLLQNVRAARLILQPGVAWRAVFTIDDSQMLVRVIALGPHDDAYRDATRRA